MKRFAVALCAFAIMSATATAQTSTNVAKVQPDGPFGFKMGDDIRNYPMCRPYREQGTFFCATSPKGFPNAIDYIVQYHPATGICDVRTSILVGKEYLGVSGTSSAIDDLARQLDYAYGAHREVSDQYDLYKWDASSGMKPKNGVTEVDLGKPDLAGIGYVSSIAFYSDHYSDCAARIDEDFKNSHKPEDLSNASKF